MTRLLLVALLALTGAPAALAQDVYPSRPISLVVPFPPGGVADLTARPVAAAMEKVLKQPVGVSTRRARRAR
jgi:tripartite-type tricarboxylate transporter receptor subunit TctC